MPGIFWDRWCPGPGERGRAVGQRGEPMTMPYPRDLIGYGAEPPHAQWPGEARIALQFVINYEEGAENAIFHGDPAAEAFLSEWVGAAPTLCLIGTLPAASRS